MALHVFTGNTAAIGIYESIGYAARLPRQRTSTRKICTHMSIASHFPHRLVI